MLSAVSGALGSLALPATVLVAAAGAGRLLHHLVHTSAGASSAAAPSEQRSGLPKRYSNLEELEADAQPLLTPQARCCWVGT